MNVSMIGHSSVVIEMGGMRILTDPFFGLRGNLAYSRPKPPFRKREDLVDVDLVLVSHNHFDHTDSGFFRLLPTATPLVAPSRTAWITRLKGAKNVTGMAPWEQKTFGTVKITAVPAWHTTITHGFILESGGATIYFAADTYYGAFMEKIAREFKPQVVLMPVTTFRIPLTMGEKGALAATRVLSPEVIIPIHLGIRPRSPLIRNAQTPQRFEKRLRQEGIPTQVVLLNEGESWGSTN